MHPRKYSVLHIFNSGTIEKVFEDGIFDQEINELRLKGVNPFSKELEGGINIKSIFRIPENKIIWELMELRPQGKWELGYRTIFRRKQRPLSSQFNI